MGSSLDGQKTDRDHLMKMIWADLFEGPRFDFWWHHLLFFQFVVSRSSRITAQIIFH